MCVHSRCTLRGEHLQTFRHTHAYTHNTHIYAHIDMHTIPVCAALLVWGHLGNLLKTLYNLGQASVNSRGLVCGDLEDGQRLAPGLPPTAELGPEPARISKFGFCCSQRALNTSVPGGTRLGLLLSWGVQKSSTLGQRPEPWVWNRRVLHSPLSWSCPPELLTSTRCILCFSRWICAVMA